MRLSKLSRICVAPALCLASVACAQQPAEPPDPILLHRSPVKAEDAKQAAKRMHLDVVVTDASGKPIPDLDSQDFALLEDNHPLQTLSFQSFDGAKEKPDPPVKVILVFDALNNGFTELGLIRQGMEQFLRQNGGHLTQPVSLDLLTVSGLQKLSGPTTDGNALAAIVDKIKPSIPPQGVYTFPISMLALGHIAEEESTQAGRKMLIWPGRGWSTPQSSQNEAVLTPQQERERRSDFNLMVLLSNGLQEARISLYGGYINSGFYQRDFLKGAKTEAAFDPQSMSLAALALKSGGRGGLAYVNGDSDLCSQLNGFVAEANAFYTLSFEPLKPGHMDEYHDLKVVVAKPGLVAHTQTGYYYRPDLTRAAPAKTLSKLTKSIEEITPFVARPVTVAELERILSGLKQEPDEKAAKELAGLKLTERLSDAKLAEAMAALHGPKERSALTALADASVFLSLPDWEIPTQPAPDIVEQKRIVSLTVNYLAKTIPRLPNFYATRTTIRYTDTREVPAHPEKEKPTGEPLHEAGSSSSLVIYRDGNEVVKPVSHHGKEAPEKGLETRGTFGPILSMVMVDASHSKMTFDHWEQGANGLDAVFVFVVPQDKSHYDVAYQSPADLDQSYDLDRRSGYHGEMAIDAKTGAILRLSVEADLALGLSIGRADILVEYGPVDIGGRTYICPVKSVSLAEGSSEILMLDPNGSGSALGPPITRLNDVTFGDYHMFRGEVRILSGADEPGNQ